MVACPECGRDLTPFEITSGGKTWTHRPHCWHPDTDECYGEEMTRERAIQLATWTVEEKQDAVHEAQLVLEQLQKAKDGSTV